MVPRAHLQQLVQQLVAEHQSNNDRVSHELFNNIAQSLAAIKTQLFLLEKRLPAESTALSGNMQDQEKNLQAVIEQVCLLADGIYSNVLANLGFEAAVKELCERTTSAMDFPVQFGSNLNGQLPGWVVRQQSVCLYYFIEQVLANAAGNYDRAAVILSSTHGRLSVMILLTHKDDVRAPDQDNLLGILEEWLGVWGGFLKRIRHSARLTSISSWIEAGELSSGAEQIL